MTEKEEKKIVEFLEKKGFQDVELLFNNVKTDDDRKLYIQIKANKSIK